MALSVVLTKEGVHHFQGPIYTVRFKMVVNDGAVDVMTQDFGVRHNTNGADMDSLKTSAKEKMEELLDVYKAEKAVFDSPDLDVARTVLQTEVNIYANKTGVDK